MDLQEQVRSSLAKSIVDVCMRTLNHPKYFKIQGDLEIYWDNGSLVVCIKEENEDKTSVMHANLTELHDRALQKVDSIEENVEKSGMQEANITHIPDRAIQKVNGIEQDLNNEHGSVLLPNTQSQVIVNHDSTTVETPILYQEQGLECSSQCKVATSGVQYKLEPSNYHNREDKTLSAVQSSNPDYSHSPLGTITCEMIKVERSDSERGYHCQLRGTGGQAKWPSDQMISTASNIYDPDSSGSPSLYNSPAVTALGSCLEPVYPGSSEAQNIICTYVQVRNRHSQLQKHQVKVEQGIAENNFQCMGEGHDLTINILHEGRNESDSATGFSDSDGNSGHLVKTRIKVEIPDSCTDEAKSVPGISAKVPEDVKSHLQQFDLHGSCAAEEGTSRTQFDVADSETGPCVTQNCSDTAGPDKTNTNHSNKKFDDLNHVPRRKNTETVHTCETCGDIFHSLDSLKLHQKTHSIEKSHLAIIPENREVAVDGSGPSMTHLASNFDSKPHVCDVCSKRFSKASALSRHKLVHGVGEKPFVCDTCGKTFTQSNLLKRHRLTHTGERPYLCQTCGKGFSEPGNLRRHEKLHGGPEAMKTKSFICNACGKSFFQSSHLKEHFLIHSGKKPYLCSICGRGFNCSGHLKTHIRTHTGEKPFCCDACESRFARPRDLKKHKCKPCRH